MMAGERGKVVLFGVGEGANGDHLPTQAEMEHAVQRSHPKPFLTSELTRIVSSQHCIYQRALFGPTLPRQNTALPATHTTELSDFVAGLTKIEGSGGQVRGGLQYPWVISNKYYSAEVDVVLASSAGPADGTEAAGTDVSLLDGAAAVVVFSRRFTAITVETISTQWGAAIAAVDPEIRLLLEVPELDADGNAIEPDTAAGEEVLQWALAHQFEYVEPEDSGEDAGSAGFSRAAEALQSHMWPGMTMKARGGPAPASPSTGDEISGVNEGAEDECVTESTATDAGTAEAEKVDGEVDTALAADVGGVDGLLGGFNLEGLLSSMEVLTKEVDGEVDDDIEMNDDAFMTMIEQMKMMKEQAKSLPDAQRKEYAEKVAMKFYESLCAGEEDED